MKEYEIPLPCDVDYSKISDGVKFRKTQFRNGQLEIDHIFRSIGKDEVDLEAHAICEEIYSVEELAYAWENRWNFMRYLQRENNVSIYDFKGGYIDRFDDKMLQLFEDRYFSAKNSEKRELCMALLEVNFANERCSKQTDKKITKANLEKLSDKLDEYIASDRDRISILIACDFKAEIEKKIESFALDE